MSTTINVSVCLQELSGKKNMPKYIYISFTPLERSWSSPLKLPKLYNLDSSSSLDARVTRLTDIQGYWTTASFPPLTEEKLYTLESHRRRTRSETLPTPFAAFALGGHPRLRELDRNPTIFSSLGSQLSSTQEWIKIAEDHLWCVA